MDVKAELLKLADDVKATALKVVEVTRVHLEYKIDLEKREADYKLGLKMADPKTTQVAMNLNADSNFTVDRKLEVSQKLAAKQAEIAAEYAYNKLAIEKIIATLPK